MTQYEVWVGYPDQYGGLMWEAQRWSAYGAAINNTRNCGSYKVTLPLPWARGLAQEICEKTGLRTEVRCIKKYTKVMAKYGPPPEYTCSFDDDMEGIR